MAEVKRLPSGKWQAIVVTPLRLPSGRPKRVTKSHSLKGVVSEWATGLEAAIAAGTWLDPRSTAMTLGEWRTRWVATRIADSATARKNESHWRNHIEPWWAGHPLSLISRGEVKTWVHQLHTASCPRCRQRPGLTRDGLLIRHKTEVGRPCGGSGSEPGLGAWTIQGAFAHLSGLLSAAVDEGALPGNPAAGVKLPTVSKKPPFFWTRAEAAQILLQLGGADALAADLAMHVGYRPGELFGLRREFVDTDSWQIHVYGVATRTGWRPWPKSSKSHRPTPVPPHLRDRLAEHLLPMAPGDLVFPAPEGGVWDDRNYARRVFEPAVAAAGVRRGTVYDMRHTAASWLVQRGVPLLEVQNLMGHEKYSTTLRYAHLQPGAFGAVLDAWGDDSLDPRADSLSSRRPHEAPDVNDRPASRERETGR